MPLRLGLRLLLATLACALVTSALQGFPAAASAAEPAQDRPKLPSSCTRNGGNMTYRAAPCYLTPFRRNRPTVVLWGDSHAYQQIPAVRPLARRQGVNLVMFMLGGCAPILVGANSKQKMYACEKSNQLALQFVRRLERRRPPVRVLLGAFWQGYRDMYQRIYVDRTFDSTCFRGGLSDSFLRSIRKFQKRTPRLFRTLGDLGVRVDVMGQAAILPAIPPRCWPSFPYAGKQPRRQMLPQERPTKRWLRLQMRKVPTSSRLIDFNGPYCGANRCFGKVGRIYTFFDAWHLSATRTRALKRFFRPTFSAFR